MTRDRSEAMEAATKAELASSSEDKQHMTAPTSHTVATAKAMEAKEAEREKALQAAKDLTEQHDWDASDYETRPEELDELELILYSDDYEEENSAGDRWDKWVEERRSRIKKERREQAGGTSSSEEEEPSAAENQPTPAAVRLPRGLVPSRGKMMTKARRGASARKPEATGAPTAPDTTTAAQSLQKQAEASGTQQLPEEGEQPLATTDPTTKATLPKVEENMDSSLDDERFDEQFKADFPALSRTARVPGRKRPTTDPKARQIDAAKQRAGIIGAERKAEKKRIQTEAALSDSSRALKKGRSGNSTQLLASIESVDEAQPIYNTEFVDKSGRKFNLTYPRTTIAERDSLWARLSKNAAQLRDRIEHDLVNSSLTEAELKTIDLQHSAVILPALVQNDEKLRVRKQQEAHKMIKAKAIPVFLRKIEKAAKEILLLMSNQDRKENSTTQGMILTRLLELPKTERTISLQEHNDIIRGYEYYLGSVAEKLRLDLAWFHLTMEKFVEKACQHEARLAALCLSIEELKVTDEAKLPQLAIDYAEPGSHPCRCETCQPEFGTELREELTIELRREVRSNIERELRTKGMKEIQDDVSGQLWQKFLTEAKAIIEPQLRATLAATIENDLRQQIESELRSALTITIKQEFMEMEATEARQRATEAAELATTNDQIDQEWDHYRAEIDARITELRAFPPPPVPTSSCFLGYQEEPGRVQELNHPPNHWYDSTNPDSLCSLLRGLELWKRPIFDASKANSDLKERQPINVHEFCEETQKHIHYYENRYIKNPIPVWSRERGALCDEERQLLDTLRQQSLEVPKPSMTPEHGVKTEYMQQLISQAEAVTAEWHSQLPNRRIGWPEKDWSDEGRLQRQMRMVRNNWLKMVEQMETDNRQEIETLLEEEDTRRGSQPLCNIPRCLIELTPAQWDGLGPEPPRAPSKVEGAHLLHQQVDIWRQRFLASREVMEEDPVSWLKCFRGPNQYGEAITQENLNLWAEDVGLQGWASQVQEQKLNAVDAYVLWEKTVKSNELNLLIRGELRYPKQLDQPTSPKESWEN